MSRPTTRTPSDDSNTISSASAISRDETKYGEKSRNESTKQNGKQPEHGNKGRTTSRDTAEQNETGRETVKAQLNRTDSKLWQDKTGQAVFRSDKET